MVFYRSAAILTALSRRLSIQQFRDAGGGYRRHLAAKPRESTASRDGLITVQERGNQPNHEGHKG